MIFLAYIESHQIKRHSLVVLTELYGLHGFAHQFGVIKYGPVPCKYGVGLQVEIVHDVGIGIDIVFTATDHLFLTCFQEVEHSSLFRELGINGQRLHRHTNGMLELLLGTVVENRGKQRFLLVVILGQQEGICRREESAFLNAIGLTEGIHLVHVDVENADFMGGRVFGNLEVGDELGKCVTTVKILGIPLFSLFKGWCFAHLGFGKGKFLHRHLLGGKRVTVVSLLHIAKHVGKRGAVEDDMMCIEEPIEMVSAAHHFNMKQPAAIKLERLNELLFLCLYVGTV